MLLHTDNVMDAAKEIQFLKSLEGVRKAIWFVIYHKYMVEGQHWTVLKNWVEFNSFIGRTFEDSLLPSAQTDWQKGILSLSRLKNGEVEKVSKIYLCEIISVKQHESFYPEAPKHGSFYPEAPKTSQEGDRHSVSLGLWITFMFPLKVCFKKECKWVFRESQETGFVNVSVGWETQFW